MKNRERAAFPSCIQLADLQVDLDGRRFTRDGRAWEKLEGLSFRLLEELLQAAPLPVSRRRLMRRLWGETQVDPATLTQRVKLLRRTLGGNQYVAAVKGFGYRLGSPPVTVRESPARSFPRLALHFIVAVVGMALAIIAFPPHAVTHFIKHLLAVQVR